LDTKTGQVQEKKKKGLAGAVEKKGLEGSSASIKSDRGKRGRGKYIERVS